MKSNLFGLTNLKQPTARTTFKDPLFTKSSRYGIDPNSLPRNYHNAKPFNYGDGSSSWFQTLDGKVTMQLGAAALQGLASGITQSSQNKSYDVLARGHEYQKGVALINAEIAKTKIAGAYESGAYEAMVQGLADRQKMSQEIVRQGSSGTKIGKGSNADISTTQWINSQINQKIIQKNTTANINHTRMELANHNAQAILEQAKADAKRALKVNPFVTGTLGFIQAVGYSMLSYNTQSLNSPLEKAFFS